MNFVDVSKITNLALDSWVATRTHCPRRRCRSMRHRACVALRVGTHSVELPLENVIRDTLEVVSEVDAGFRPILLSWCCRIGLWLNRLLARCRDRFSHINFLHYKLLVLVTPADVDIKRGFWRGHIGAFAGSERLILGLFQLLSLLFCFLSLLISLDPLLFLHPQVGDMVELSWLRLLLLAHLRAFLFELVVELGVLAPHLHQLLEIELLIGVHSDLVLVAESLHLLFSLLHELGLLWDLLEGERLLGLFLGLHLV